MSHDRSSRSTQSPQSNCLSQHGNSAKDYAMDDRLKLPHLGCSLFGLSLVLIGMSLGNLACSAFGIRYTPLRITYFPHLVKGQPRDLPARRLIVLLPVDTRPNLTVQGGTLATQATGKDIVAAQLSKRKVPPDGITPEAAYPVIGFLGTSSRGNIFLSQPDEFVPPDQPQLLFYTTPLQQTVQSALAMHIQEVGLPVQTVPFTSPRPHHHMPQATIQPEAIKADYALGCEITDFTLRSLLYRVDGGMHGDVHKVLGPSWAEVKLVLALYRWPSGEKVWEGHIGEQLSDPEPGEVMPLYGSMGEVLGMALSRAVGSFLITQAVQDILSSKSTT